ncbi:hypothetical protein AB0B45_37565 [Nonomuraea sp. NPDC049152]|uniref:hypothetical protein n=1 Tax=Nonomuraea sp. NPDC049152 TaxID=3154350 RepID=UPI0033D5CC14
MKEIVREDDGALLGYVGRAEGGWQPMTVFGYPLGPAAGEDAAEELVRREGLDRLAGRWEFRSDGGWYSCVLQEADLARVRIRPTDPGYPGHEHSLELSKPGTGELRPLGWRP